jgi:hypothetical protein
VCDEWLFLMSGCHGAVGNNEGELSLFLLFFRQIEPNHPENTKTCLSTVCEIIGIQYGDDILI